VSVNASSVSQRPIFRPATGRGASIPGTRGATRWGGGRRVHRRGMRGFLEEGLQGVNLKGDGEQIRRGRRTGMTGGWVGGKRGAKRGAKASLAQRC